MLERMTVRAPLGRRLAPLTVMAVGAAVSLVGSFLPWVHTGSRARNSYDVFRVVDRLGFAPDGPAATAMRWWPIVPLLGVAALVATWWGWARPGGLLGGVAACYGLAAGIAVHDAPQARVVDIGGGSVVTMIGSGVFLAGALGALVVGVGAPVSPPTARGGRARP
jgi:hypothetical protein